MRTDAGTLIIDRVMQRGSRAHPLVEVYTYILGGEVRESLCLETPDHRLLRIIRVTRLDAPLPSSGVGYAKLLLEGIDWGASAGELAEYAVGRQIRKILERLMRCGFGERELAEESMRLLYSLARDVGLRIHECAR